MSITNAVQENLLPNRDNSLKEKNIYFQKLWISCLSILNMSNKHCTHRNIIKIKLYLYTMNTLCFRFLNSGIIKETLNNKGGNYGDKMTN